MSAHAFVPRALAGLLLGAALAVALPARGECPSRFTFTLIADDTGPLTLEDPQVLEAVSLPTLSADGEVAFKAWPDSGGAGLYSGDGVGAVVEWVLDRGADPRSDLTWLYDPVIGGTTQLAFGARVALDGPVPETVGVWVVSFGGSPRRIALGGEVEGSPYASVEPVADLDATGDVTFAVTFPGGRRTAVARSRGGGAVTHVVDSDREPVEGIAAPVATDGGDVAFAALSTDPATGYGLFRSSAAGAFSVLVGTDPDTGLGPASNAAISEGGAVAFAEAYPDPAQPGRAAVRIRRWSPVTGSSIVLADSGRGDFRPAFNRTVVSIASGVDATGPGPSDRPAGCVVFNGFDPEDGRDAIYIADEDGFHPIVRQGDPLLDGVAGLLAVSGHAINPRGQVAFYAWLDVDRRAVVRADPVDGAGGDPTDPDDPPGDPGDPSDPTGGDPGDPAGRAAPGDDGSGCAAGSGGPAPPAPLLALAAALALLALHRRRRPRQRPAASIACAHSAYVPSKTSAS